MVFATAISDKLNEMFEFKFVPQTFVAILVMAIILILFAIIGAKAKKAKIDEKPKGILLIGIIYFEFIENFTLSIMSRKYRGFAKIIMVVAAYLFLCFIIGLTGLPSPITYIATPLSLALVTFGCVHGTAIKENKWRYFKRYVEPVAVFLPVNLLSMWAPTLALTCRLFGNAVSGYCIMSLVYFGLQNVSDLIFASAQTGLMASGSIWIAPIITPFLHAYFDLFSGFIQTLVFTMLTLIYVSQEQSEEDGEQVIDSL